MSRSQSSFLTKALLVGFVAVFPSLAFVAAAEDPSTGGALFRGVPESEWIAKLKYNDRNQVDEWLKYGDEGVQVLARGMVRETHRGERAYRKLNRKLPNTVRRVLPDAKPDSTQARRECIASLLASLANFGKDAHGAVPVMIDVALNDESLGVRLSAFNYFSGNRSQYCLLKELTARQKRRLLPAYLRAFQDTSNDSLRHNASSGLKFFPEHAKQLVPILVKGLQDPNLYVRVYAAEALNSVDAAAGRKAGATAVLIATARQWDDQVASNAVEALGSLGSDPELAVPALVGFLQGKASSVSVQAVWSLQWAPDSFQPYREQVVAGLTEASKREDSVGGYAKAALKSLEMRAIASGHSR